MSRLIEITVSPKGEAVIQTTGFRGEKCREASHRLETALGIRSHERMTSEFHTAAENSHPARQS